MKYEKVLFVLVFGMVGAACLWSFALLINLKVFVLCLFGGYGIANLFFAFGLLVLVLVSWGFVVYVMRELSNLDYQITLEAAV
ncbi:MAG: hypothetical protein NWF06_00755 [Candidatus Bathyarchaeota archaeon]|nr:hypothetical protein [Candidatus Bathyarchaeum sp.]